MFKQMRVELIILASQKKLGLLARQIKKPTKNKAKKITARRLTNVQFVVGREVDAIFVSSREPPTWKH